MHSLFVVMDRFVVRKHRTAESDDAESQACGSTSSEHQQSQSSDGQESLVPSAKRPSCQCAGKLSVSAKMRAYKSHMRYNWDWEKKWQWLLYDEVEDGMLCSICTKFGKPPPQSHGAWVTRAIRNWGKATELFSNHERSEWHRASVEAQVLSETAEKHGDVMDKLLAASEIERQQNRELVKKLIRSLYFLVTNRIPHMTTFGGLIQLQIDNGNEQLKQHKLECPSNATYLSKLSIAELLKSISHVIEQGLLARLQASPYFSVMADESTDVASMEELCVCARWLEGGKAVEHFLGIIHLKEASAEAITKCLCQFLQEKCLSFKKVRGLGFDGASTTSGAKSGVQIRMRYHSPSAVYIHCRCHQLQLAAVCAAKEHNQVMRVLGTLLTMWKAFHYSPKRQKHLLRYRLF